MEKNQLATTTNNEFLEIYSPKALQLQFREVTTIALALQTKSKSIALLKNEYSEDKIAALIKLQLIELNEILNLKRPLSETQIDAIADEVLIQYYHLTMADIYLIFRRARIGHYGEFYESINMPKVLSWFRSYFDERCEEAARQSMDNASQYKYIGDRTCDENAKNEHRIQLGVLKQKLMKNNPNQ